MKIGTIENVKFDFNALPPLAEVGAVFSSEADMDKTFGHSSLLASVIKSSEITDTWYLLIEDVASGSLHRAMIQRQDGIDKRYNVYGWSDVVAEIVSCALEQKREQREKSDKMRKLMEERTRMSPKDLLMAARTTTISLKYSKVAITEEQIAELSGLMLELDKGVFDVFGFHELLLSEDEAAAYITRYRIQLDVQNAAPALEARQKLVDEIHQITAFDIENVSVEVEELAKLMHERGRTLEDISTGEALEKHDIVNLINRYKLDA